MSDLYSQQQQQHQYPPRQTQFQSFQPPQHPQHQQQPQQHPQLHPHQHQQHQQPQEASSSDDDNHSNQVTPTPPPSATTPRSDQSPPKQEGKPQATFLTKLYALLERPENQHMIRWDAEGKHIIVERPEQLALHVLPSIYRQSRFASFSRQLNIYGFMRKVNLRNVDPSIDDPDASTWSHPTLDRNSPPEVVANFKRRVPPRLPKPRKRQDTMNDQGGMIPPRSGVGLGVPLTVPSSISVPSASGGFQRGRSRGFSAPGAYASGHWGPASYNPRQALPPLTVPTDSPPHLPHYGNPSHPVIPPITPTDDLPGQPPGFSPAGYSAPGSSGYSSYAPTSSVGSHAYGYGGSESSSNWSFPPLNPAAGSSGGHSNLSSILNPSSNYASRPSIQTYSTHPHYASLASNQSPVSLSPDSRPATGYSVASSLSSMQYDPAHPQGDYDSRPGSSQQGRPLTPVSRNSPTIKTGGGYPASGLSIRRERRHSHAVSPYPSPYENADGRPMTAPGHPDSPPASNPGAIPRVKSLMHVAGQNSAENNAYNYQPAQAEFAYSSSPGVGNAPPDGQDRNWMSQENNSASQQVPRPSTSASTMSAASHSSTEQATETPPAPMESGRYPETDIDRFSSELGIQRADGMTTPFPKTLAVDA